LPPTTTTTSTSTTTTIPLTPLWESIEGDNDLGELVAAVEEADLVALFDGSAPPAEILQPLLPEAPPQAVTNLLDNEGITVLAPTNMAIEALPAWDDIVADPAALQRFVLAHVLPGRLDEEAIFASEQVTALSGDVLQVDAGTQTINGAHLVVVGQPATNGVLHTVDAVLVVPPLTPPTTQPPTTPPAEVPAEPPPAEPPAPPPPTEQPPLVPPTASVP
jgi:uncharacterized surface protein with fasciclin (FAS1) repeats